MKCARNNATMAANIEQVDGQRPMPGSLVGDLTLAQAWRVVRPETYLTCSGLNRRAERGGYPGGSVRWADRRLAGYQSGLLALGRCSG